MNLDEIISHCRNREYMSGVERNKVRVKATQEVFTPTSLVQTILDELPSEYFTDPTKTVIDNSCGDGQFLSEVLIRKVSSGINFETALSTLYGVDIMQDNVDLCRERLLCGQEQYRHIVEKNIQCRNGLKYSYSFDPMGPARRKTEEATRKRTARAKDRQRKEEEQAKIETKLFGKPLKDKSK